jgi:hypothetical protein
MEKEADAPRKAEKKTQTKKIQVEIKLFHSLNSS